MNFILFLKVQKILNQLKMHPRKLCQHLRKNDCEQVRTNKHPIWENINTGKKVSLPSKKRGDLAKPTVMNVCKTLGIPNPF